MIFGEPGSMEWDFFFLMGYINSITIQYSDFDNTFVTLPYHCRFFDVKGLKKRERDRARLCFRFW